MDRRTFLKASAASAVLPGLAGAPSAAFAQSDQNILRIAMTLSDIPLTTGQPTQGAEGIRFMGMTVYDALFSWDLSQNDTPSVLVPGLAESYTVDSETNTIWTFHLRRGVRFHDGSDFTADSVIWNFEKLLNREAPQFDQAQANQGAARFAGVVSYRKVDDYTVEVVTEAPDSMFFYRISAIYFSSPAHWEALGGDWGAFAQNPSGTGPFKLESFVPRERANLVRNDDYWDTERVPRVDGVTLLAMPDATTRVAALLSGQVDWVEAPPPDAVPRLTSQGMDVYSMVYPHVWPFWLSYAEDSPFRDINVRKAANLAIDRDGIAAFLGGLAKPAKGMVDVSSPWFGNPEFDIVHDPDQARTLLAEAGYGPDNPCVIKLLTSQAGSGQMQPIPMTEYVQENLNSVGFQVEVEVVDWEALRTRRGEGADSASNAGTYGVNSSWSINDPDFGLLSVTWSRRIVPNGNNWGLYSDPTADTLCENVVAAFDPDEQDQALAELHEYMVDQAMWLWVVHDLNPRALNPRVRNFLPPQSWYVDLTGIEVV